ncbi:galactokinase [Ekhidna sp.]
MNRKLIDKVKSKISELSDHSTLLVRAPGRINLIGEHTDYNKGFVLPAAIDLGIYFAFSLSNDSTCRVIALDEGESLDFTLDELEPLAGFSWKNYVLGVVSRLKSQGYGIEPFNIVFTGDLPQGSGLSSSAALECGVCFGLNELFHLDLSRREMALTAQWSEHHFVGVMCGIMDQYASLFGVEDHAILLDCDSLNHEVSPIKLSDHKFLLINSEVKHSHASSGYNVRREQTEEGVEIIARTYTAVRSMRDMHIEILENCKSSLSDKSYRRCKYIIEENERVHGIVEAMKSDDLGRVGELLKQGQEGMKNGYEITCEEIDFLADFANDYQGVLGARMMGGGFGGCTINLIERSIEDQFVSDIGEAYKKEFDINSTPISVEISDGVHIISESN